MKKSNCLRLLLLVITIVFAAAQPADAFYASNLGRWVSRDPIEYGDETNVYGFVRGNPNNEIDPSGEYGRKIPSIVFKRNDIRYRALWKTSVKGEDSREDIYGHYWTEIDGTESYGWWPKYPVSLKETLKGVPGELNGITSFHGTATRDPHHGDTADHELVPVLVEISFFSLQAGSGKGTKCCNATDEQIKDCIRAKAKKQTGGWRFPWGVSCQSFQGSLQSGCCLHIVKDEWPIGISW